MRVWGLARLRAILVRGMLVNAMKEGRPRVPFNESPSYERSTHQVENLDYEQTPETHDSRNLCRMRNSSRSVTERRYSSPEYYGLKIPLFNVKEDWKTWINRFEAISESRNWTQES